MVVYLKPSIIKFKYKLVENRFKVFFAYKFILTIVISGNLYSTG